MVLVLVRSVNFWSDATIPFQIKPLEYEDWMKNSDEKVNVGAFRDAQKQYLRGRDYSRTYITTEMNHPTLFSKRWLWWHDLHPAPDPRRAAHPHQEFPVVPSSGDQEQGVNHVIIIIAWNITLDDSFRLLFTYLSNPSPLALSPKYRFCALRNALHWPSRLSSSFSPHTELWHSTRILLIWLTPMLFFLIRCFLLV